MRGSDIDVVSAPKDPFSEEMLLLEDLLSRRATAAGASRSRSSEVIGPFKVFLDQKCSYIRGFTIGSISDSLQCLQEDELIFV